MKSVSTSYGLWTKGPGTYYPGRTVLTIHLHWYSLMSSFRSEAANQRAIIVDAAGRWRRSTDECLSWRDKWVWENVNPARPATDYVAIRFGFEAGCWSYVGKIGGRQVLNLGDTGGCITKGIIQHEMLHAFGVWHEQSRPDRLVQISLINFIQSTLFLWQGSIHHNKLEPHPIRQRAQFREKECICSAYTNTILRRLWL